MKNVNISANIPVELNAKLEEIAKKQDRSKNYIIKQYLEKGLSEVIGLEEKKVKEWDFKKELEESTKKNGNIIKALAEK